MVEILLSSYKKEDVLYLEAICEVRYWEDATVNGMKDTDGNLIPLRAGDNWKILIDIEQGRILDWPNGTAAKTHYKVCDCGTYRLLDKDKRVIVEIEGYVPSIMSSEDNGWGDYIIMNINEQGFIKGWKLDLKAFQNADEED